MSKIWYAVQEEPSDGYDIGSYDYKKARRMAKDVCKRFGQAIIVYYDTKLGMSVDQEIVERNNY